VLVLNATATFAQTLPQNAESQKHLDAATANAGSDPLFVQTLRRQWCYTAENAGVPVELADHTIMPLTQIFDDVWFVGPRWVSQYIFKTDKGFFLIDTLNNAGEAQTITVPALQQLGMTPAFPLLAAMPTHGHPDHFGGASYLQTTFGIPVYLGSADAANKPFTVTPLDSTNLAPQSLAIPGNFVLTLLSTPGHTPGTFSGVIPVHHKGVVHKVSYWGGTAMPGTVAAARQYLDGAERLYALSEAVGSEGTIHTHAFVDGSLVHVDEIIAAGGRRDPNPFILGEAQTLRSLAMLRECSAAKVAQLDATALIPVWRVTTIEFAEHSPSPHFLSARVASAWGPVVGKPVTFTVGDDGEACVATTDADGVATCDVDSLPRRIGRDDIVTASFAGAAGLAPGGQYVDLASSVSMDLDRRHRPREKHKHD